MRGNLRTGLSQGAVGLDRRWRNALVICRSRTLVCDGDDEREDRGSTWRLPRFPRLSTI